MFVPVQSHAHIVQCIRSGVGVEQSKNGALAPGVLCARSSGGILFQARIESTRAGTFIGEIGGKYGQPVVELKYGEWLKVNGTLVDEYELYITC
jgi:hypothetical protein